MSSKVVATLVLLMVSACNSETTPPEPGEEIADPNCKPYLAVPGETCREGHWLYIDGMSRYPRPALCSCDTKAVKPVK